MNSGFVIASRIKSSRAPGKALQKYNGVAQIQHLINQLKPAGLPIYVAVPASELIQYAFLSENKNVIIFTGYEDDPMERTYECAKKYKLDTVIRVTHDKIFCNLNPLQKMLEQIKCGYDYVYSSSFIPGTGYEIISLNALELACSKFKRVEHISYAIKAVTKNILDYKFQPPRHDIRLLIDYPEDVLLMTTIFATLGSNITYKDAVKILDQNNILKQINRLPLVTIYTCAKNAGKWIAECMDSVKSQSVFPDSEYLLIDDYSEDRTVLLMAKFAQANKNVRFMRNEKNIGLASSSNIALKNAKGKYIIRLDADDFFIKKDAISGMIADMEKQQVDAIYPNCYAGLSQKTIQRGDENHHAGCALFRTSAINHIKFTDNLRNYDSLDLFLRAKDILKIGYHNRIVFTYRQHNKSMSKTNLAEREITKKTLLEKYASKV